MSSRRVTLQKKILARQIPQDWSFRQGYRTGRFFNIRRREEKCREEGKRFEENQTA
jgi:hypothetical protein